MARAPSKPPYTLLARYYDRLIVEHPKLFQRARRRLLGKILPQVRSVCELACGTGTTALEFARRGLRVFAVDDSSAMCRLTQQKARRARLPVQVLRADMRSFRLPQPVDLVTCEFDAINHVPRKADLGRVARAVARALRPGGYFYFDVNTQRAFKEIWPRSWYIETPKFVLASHGGYDRRRRKGRSQFEWFLPEGKQWRRATETYQQVCWTHAEIRRALRRAGFDRVRAWDSHKVIPGPVWIRPGCRTFYLAQKSRDPTRKM
ncbi:MAG: class I SAM-dependent DNA methyltransferase [Terriglobia bacterium]